jgi:cytoskeletal protein RodZ
MRRALTLLALLALLVSAPLAQAASTTVTESYATLLHQVDTNQVVIAHVNEETNDIRVTLKNGSEQFVRFQHAEHKTLIDALIHHGVTPIYTVHKAAKKPVHHVLRYIAGGVVVVLLLVGAGVWVYTRGQRQPAATPPADPQPASGPDPPQTPGAPPA